MADRISLGVVYIFRKGATAFQMAGKLAALLGEDLAHKRLLSGEEVFSSSCLMMRSTGLGIRLAGEAWRQKVKAPEMAIR